MLDIEKNLQYWLYQLLERIEYNPEYSAKEIKKDIAGILADVSGIKRYQVLDTIKEEIANFNDYHTN
jgi:hypothetical protein